MIVKEYRINKKGFLRKKRTILRKYIRDALKVYSINGFVLDEDNNVASCKVRIKKCGIVQQIKTVFNTYYYTEPIPKNDLDVRLKLHISTIGPTDIA